MEFSDLIGPGTIPPAIVLILYILWHRWQDIRAAGARLYSDKIEDSRDRREQRQALTERQQNYELLQASWREDKLATLLEENSSFIRETVSAKLDKIETLTIEVRQVRQSLQAMTGHLAKLTDNTINRHD
ncbi:MAG: hypothetical protein ACE5G8_06340 [Anaerolineae bacterium]